MGIKAWVKNFLKPMKKPFGDVAKNEAGEPKVGESAYDVASRRWKLYKRPRLRRAGIWARLDNRGRIPHGWRRVFSTRKIPKPVSYNNAGAGTKRRKERELLRGCAA
jgi:hypothetical protein